MANTPSDRTQTVAARSKTDRSGRPDRAAIDADMRSRLGVKNLDTDNFSYRWVNDKENRLAMFQQYGYEFVTDPLKVGEGNSVLANPMGSAISRAVGTNIVAYLMRIPLDLYNEAQYQAMADIRQTEAAIKSNLPGFTGGIDIQDA